jgi:predicted transcriptional regulator of viral defense system
MPVGKTQRDLAKDMLRARGIVRLSEFKTAGITAATIGRMRSDGDIIRLARGLYQLPDAPLDANHSLAEAAKRVPKGVVCLTSALAFHELTDQLPRSIWLAIGKNDWSPQDGEPALRIVRFTDGLLAEDVETTSIEGVPVKVFGVAKTIADCFRHRRSVGQSVALEGLQEALRQRKATPAQIARSAASGGVSTIVRPYLEALTANG